MSVIINSNVSFMRLNQISILQTLTPILCAHRQLLHGLILFKVKSRMNHTDRGKISHTMVYG